jgi:predicted kinase
MSTLHFFCGKAGAGKTTAARKLAREQRAILICEDEWVSRLADPVTTLREYLAATARIRSVLAPLAVDLLRLGVPVVFDFGGNTVGDRRWARSVFEEANAAHVLHYIKADDRTCLLRVQTRNATKPEGLSFGVVTDAQVEQVNRYFCPPAPDEGLNVVFEHP